MHARLITAVVLLSLALLFAIQNAGVVTIRLLFWSISTPLALLMMILLAIGLLGGWLLCSWRTRLRKT